MANKEKRIYLCYKLTILTSVYSYNFFTLGHSSCSSAHCSYFMFTLSLWYLVYVIAFFWLSSIRAHCESEKNHEMEWIKERCQTQSHEATCICVAICTHAHTEYCWSKIHATRIDLQILILDSFANSKAWIIEWIFSKYFQWSDFEPLLTFAASNGSKLYAGSILCEPHKRTTSKRNYENHISSTICTWAAYKSSARGDERHPLCNNRRLIVSFSH